jgi:hypothetical protein
MSNDPHLRILVLGAGYGLLFAVRAALGGHHVTVVCRPDEADALNAEGPVVNLTARKTGLGVQISRQSASLDIVACTPDRVDPNAYDLIVLAVQDSRFLDPQLGDLAMGIARSKRPVISIMNMALPPYLKRLNGVWNDGLRKVYHAPDLWDAFSPAHVTHTSPDPQAVRTTLGQSNVIDVTLASNFKIAPFEQPKHNEILRRLCRSANLATALHDAALKPRVQVVASRSKFVPLAKWPMLVTGNYRCVTAGAPKTIAAAVSSDPALSRRLYEATQRLCLTLGAEAKTLVPFKAYVRAAGQLDAPSSVALAIAQGRGGLERMDRLVQALHHAHCVPNPDLDAVVAAVDSRVVKS